MESGIGIPFVGGGVFVGWVIDHCRSPVVSGPEDGFEPRQPPRPPLLLQATKTQGNLSASFSKDGWGFKTSYGTDYRAPKAVVGRDEMKG